MTKRSSNAGYILAAVCAIVLPVQALGADLPPVPHHSDDVHLGVASCASSNCHSAPSSQSNVLLNEAVTWLQEDKHSQAYAVLLNDQSKRIARNLGLPDAHTAEICLDCHADNVPDNRRGEKFQITDGVGCESCHGGAQDWIGVHTVATVEDPHQRNLDAGLYPTEDPKARAQLCLSCHFGNEEKFVDHRIMGAGHPRLSFELDTFTAIQPAHFEVDDDYVERKGFWDGVQVWAIGQAMALAQELDAVLSPKLGRDGIFPELVLFDCHACHKPMSAARWHERASLGLGPGVVRFNDANLIMLRIVAGAVSPALGKKIASQGRALHQASQQSRDQWLAAARALRQSALEAVDVFAGYQFDEATMRTLLDSLVREGTRGEYIDYVAAEQTTMAIGAIIQAMANENLISDEEYARYQAVMDDLYNAVAEDERYRPSVHLNSLKRLQAATN